MLKSLLPFVAFAAAIAQTPDYRAVVEHPYGLVAEDVAGWAFHRLPGERSELGRERFCVPDLDRPSPWETGCGNTRCPSHELFRERQRRFVSGLVAVVGT